MRVSHFTLLSRLGIERNMPSSHEKPERTPAHHASLGRSMVGWTNNLLATAVILIVVLTFGFQTIQWWYPKTPAGGGSSTPSPILDETALQLDFGKRGGRWKRASFAGTQRELVAEMIALTRREIATGGLAFRVQDSESWTTLSDRLQGQSAAWSDAQGHRIYVQDGPLPLAVACLARDNDASRSEATAASLLVGCWTLALPAGRLEGNLGSPAGSREFTEGDSKAWTLVLCHPQPEEVSVKSGPQPLPELFSSEFSITDDTGQTLKKFKTQKSLGETRDKIDQYWHEQGWTEIQWSENARRTQGVCRADSNRKIRVELIPTPTGIQGLVADQP